MSTRSLLLALLFAMPIAAQAAQVVPDAPAEKAAPTTDRSQASSSVSLAEIRRFTAVYSLVKQAYVDAVSDEKLMQAAIRGMLSNLDPHSEYLDRAQIESLAEETTGSYAGLGIEVTSQDGALRVIAPIDGTPAQRAGILAGDIIVRIDDVIVQSSGVDNAIEQLRGKTGSQVTLNIVREGVASPFDVTLKREIIRVASVSSRLLEPGYAYLRIAQFQAETGGELRRNVAKVLSDNGGPVKGAVLDLRSNPGGLVSAAVDVSDQFLDGGKIVSTRGRVSEADLSFSATPGDSLNGAELVVLIDNGSASASEIVAGALKDNRRALLMGRRSFGKGSVQTVLPLDGDFAVKMTTARYFTPNGTSIQAQGITPDVELADLKLAARDGADSPTVSERDLPNHLRGGTEGYPAGKVVLQTQVPTDYALNEALNLLKGLASQRQRTQVTPRG